MSASFLDAARALGPVVRAHADANEELRHLAPPLVEALRPTGLLRMLLPAAYGGPEAAGHVRAAPGYWPRAAPRAHSGS